MKKAPQITQLSWMPWALGHTILTLIVLGTHEGSVNIPNDFKLTIPKLHHIWDIAAWQLTPNLRPDWLNSVKGHLIEPTVSSESVVCGTTNVVLVKLMAWQKIHGYIVNGKDIFNGNMVSEAVQHQYNEKNRKISAEHDRFLQAPTCKKEKLHLVNFLMNCHQLHLEYLTVAKGTIFDIYDFLKDPYNYFVAFAHTRGLTPNDKLVYYINLVVEANAPYMKDVLYAESFLPDIYNQVDRVIDISNYYEILIVAMISTSLNFDYDMDKFTNTNQFLSRIQ